MFDYVRCERPLPDGWHNENELQSKDFDCSMTTVLIRDDGRLLIERFDYEEVPKAERLYPNDEGILGLIGCVRRVNRKWDDLNFHGDFSFGGLENHDYIARYTDGNLVSIRIDLE